MADVIALYNPIGEPFGFVLERFGDWRVVNVEQTEYSIPKVAEATLVVCTTVMNIPVLRLLYPQPTPIVYVGPPTALTLAKSYTPYATSCKQSLGPIVELIQRASDDNKKQVASSII